MEDKDEYNQYDEVPFSWNQKTLKSYKQDSHIPEEFHICAPIVKEK